MKACLRKGIVSKYDTIKKMTDRKDHLTDGREMSQYLKDISASQHIEDEIAFWFSIMQGDDVKPASPRRALDDLSKVRVGPDYVFDKLGPVEVKFTRNWHDELGFKSYQLKIYSAAKAKILYVNGWLDGPAKFATVDKKLLEPDWIMKNGVEPSDHLKGLFIPKGKKVGKMDIALWEDQLEWHQLS